MNISTSRKHNAMTAVDDLLTCSRKRSKIRLIFSSRRLAAVFNLSFRAFRSSIFCFSNISLFRLISSAWTCSRELHFAISSVSLHWGKISRLPPLIKSENYLELLLQVRYDGFTFLLGMFHFRNERFFRLRHELDVEFVFLAWGFFNLHHLCAPVGDLLRFQVLLGESLMRPWFGHDMQSLPSVALRPPSTSRQSLPPTTALEPRFVSAPALERCLARRESPRSAIRRVISPDSEFPLLWEEEKSWKFNFSFMALFWGFHRLIFPKLHFLQRGWNRESSQN